MGPSAYLPRMPNLWVIEVPNSTVLPEGLTLWRKHCVLFKSLSCIFPTVSEALLFVHNLHDAPMMFPFILSLQPLMDSIADTSWDTHSNF